MKQCCKCKQIKKLSDFGKMKKAKDGLHYRCKDCKRDYDNKYYKTKEGRKEQITNGRNIQKRIIKDYLVKHLMSNPCVDCGESDPFFLEFDHIRGKDYLVSRMYTYSIKTVQKEIDKCEVRCLKCHKIMTAKRAGWYNKYRERAYNIRNYGSSLPLFSDGNH